MLNVKNMTFEEFIEFGEKGIGQKIDDQLKAILSIVYENLKSGDWSQDDLRSMTDAMKNSRKAS